MIVKKADDLRDLVRRIFLAAGADERNASGVAEHLVLANLSGVDTHGVIQIGGYVDFIRKEQIVPTAWPEIIKEGPTSALVSGNWTFGQIAAKYTMEVVIQKAKEQGVAVGGLVQSYHIGRLGHFVEMAAPEGLIAMVWGGGYGAESPVAVPFGGKERVLHTNPLSFGFPLSDGNRMMFDFATTAISGVKVRNAYRRKETLPPGCIVDKDGNPSTDPDDFENGGGALPFGGHKGYALMMASEYLGRIFTGADAHADPNRGGPIMRRQGVTMIAFKADQFQAFADYSSRADEMVKRVREIPPAPGFEEVLAPGDPEVRTRAARGKEGIPIADDVWEEIVETARSLNVDID